MDKLKLAEKFFRSDGEGLSEELIDIDAYKHLLLTIESYTLPRSALIDLYNAEVRRWRKLHPKDSTEAVQPVDLDWILRLVKLRGDHEFVDAELKRRVQNRGWSGIDAGSPP